LQPLRGLKLENMIEEAEVEEIYFWAYEGTDSFDDLETQILIIC